ncbi:glycoside hydrolase family 36 protein [Sphingomonas flavalba]|uniref:glycoside hydrolase family 36 protein n=1 Tax=Sphingomonas flavalba TaxID=2559804 RepID=UPI00109DBA1F|nr:glycoside hydrolase family 36 protein [Sphingomonas flavalba]
MPALPHHRLTRRGALSRLLASGAAVTVGAGPLRAMAAEPPLVEAADSVLTIAFDSGMASRLTRAGTVLTGFDAADALWLGGGEIIDRFLLLDHDRAPLPSGPHGPGTRHTLRGVANDRIEKTVTIAFHDRYPGVALIDIRFRNIGKQPLTVAGWRAAAHDLLAHPAGAWSYAGASYPDRRDWVQPVAPGFDQRNFMGMNGSDYGGGTPVAAVWRPDAGLAVGHVETAPKLIALPVSHQPGGTRIGMEGDTAALLGPGETLELPRLFLMAHRGDHFAPLDAYRRIMAERGIAAPPIPDSSYAPIWCGWGYGHDFTVDQIIGTLPKAKALGLDWVVLDDGWQTSEGDWKVDRTKFPRDGADMKAFADRVKAAGMRPRLWFAPLTVDPGTDLMRDHPEMLLLDRSGAAQNVTWWDGFTLCPAHPPVVAYFQEHIRRIIGDWGFEGIKFDGQHLNGVAPCYNPAHHHARPEESVEKLQDFWKALYDTAMAINPQAVIELCPCGDAFAFYNIPAMNHTPASDPESSWQVRLKGKSLKALIGPSAPFAGDHVELSDGHADFASSYGVGAVPSTKFTWPKDSASPSDNPPLGGYVLTPQKEAVWRQWIALYRQTMPARGIYRGELYDIGFDKPEGHAIATADGTMHYAFFAKAWDGPVRLRGLGPGRYRLTDPLSGRALGTATAAENSLQASFTHALIVAATPMDTGAA